MGDEGIDPAQLRGAPLGWYFTLFFLIHALMPLGGAIAVAVNAPELWMGLAALTGGVVLSGVLVFVLVRTALRARKRVAHFAAARAGRRAQAQVLQMEQVGSAGTVRRGRRRTAYFKLRVHVRATFEDRIPFELTGEACYTGAERDTLTPGTMVWIGLHPSGEGPFIIHPESLRQMPALPMALRPPVGPSVQIQPTDRSNRQW